jgi:syndecan 4
MNENPAVSRGNRTFEEMGVFPLWQNKRTKYDKRFFVTYLYLQFQTWTTITEKITAPSFTLPQIKPGATYFFIVRANNAKGAGEPSPVTHISAATPEPQQRDDRQNVESLSSNKTVKLTSVYSINTTSALLTWTNVEGLNNDGFYLTWRGPPLVGGMTIMNITEAKTTSAIIEGLRAFSSYDFFLIPYRGSNNLSPSNSMELLTPEGKPAPPRNVFARMENLTSVMIAFAPPAPNEVNGVLRGFDIRFVDNSSSYENTIRTKANARSITLKNMRPGNAYQAHIAAFNGAGKSDFVSTELFTMSESLLI